MLLLICSVLTVILGSVSSTSAAHTLGTSIGTNGIGIIGAASILLAYSSNNVIPMVVNPALYVKANWVDPVKAVSGNVKSA